MNTSISTNKTCKMPENYSWHNPQAIRKIALNNYDRIIEQLKIQHKKEWHDAQNEISSRREIFNNSLSLIHGRNEDQVVTIFNAGKLRPLASFSAKERSSIGHNHTRSLDVAMGLDQYVFLSFNFNYSFGETFFAFSNKLLGHPDFFVTPEDISAYVDMDTCESFLRGPASEDPKNSFPLYLKNKLDKYMEEIIPGSNYIELLSILSVLHFQTFEDSVKFLLRGSTHYGIRNATQGIKCDCISSYFTGSYFYGAEGKMFGDVCLSHLKEIVSRPYDKEKLIANGLPLDIITGIHQPTDTYEEMFRLGIPNFRDVGKPKLSGMMPWSHIKE